MQVLIAPDKFKGTLTAGQSARAIARGWARVYPEDEVRLLPMSDGGDGFGLVMGRLLGARTRRVRTVDAAGRPIVARWWWEPRSRTAIVESAEVIGSARLPSGRFHPFALDTFGLGRVLAVAARSAPIRCLVGIGGSATNDGGSGLARALGWRFMASSGEEIHEWSKLTECEEVVRPALDLNLGALTVAVDVRNPLLGSGGCTRIYGPQKGLRPKDFASAEAALARLSGLMAGEHGKPMHEAPGAGAAGGLGFGLMAFCGATPTTGFSLFAEEAGLRTRVRDAGLVITGEGRLDSQSMMGKGVGELGTMCNVEGVPCIAISGSSALRGEALDPFERVYDVSEMKSQAHALKKPGFWLSRTAAKAAIEWPRQG